MRRANSSAGSIRALPTKDERGLNPVAVDLTQVSRVDTEPGELPETMAAWVIREERQGEPKDAFQVEEIEVPEPGAFEVIVRVMAAGVNYNNVWAALGKPVSVMKYGDHPQYGHHIGGSDASGVVWKVGAGVTQAIFDGGRIHAQNDLAQAQQQEFLASYRKTVFSAFQDVETSLDLVKSTTDQLALVEVQTKASAEAFRISELQYREGTIDILSLLTNQQALFSAQQILVQVKLQRLEAHLSLYNALGGGWDQKTDDANYKNQLDWWPL